MAIKANFEPPNVGGFLKEAILPDGMSVTDAAKLLDVGRPALSRLLNERASLAPEMAQRFEKVFGVKMDTLLRMQARFDAWHVRQRAGDLKLRPYQPA